MDEQLAHRERHRALPSEHAEVAEVLRRQRVLQEEQPVRLQRLGQTDRVDRLQPLVDVVQQFRLGRQSGTHVREQFRHPAQLLAGIEEGRTGAACVRQGAGSASDPPCVDSLVAADLAADVAEALLPEGKRPVQDLLRLASVRVHVHGRGAAAAAAPELVARKAGGLALDVPERHLHGAYRVVQHRAVAPVAVVHGAVPEVGDGRRVAADRERLHVALDRGLHGPEPLREGATAPAVEAGLVGDDLGDDQRHAGRLHGVGDDVGDAHAATPRRGCSRASLPGRSRRTGCRA